MASTKPHVVLFPFMAQGHVIPYLDLAGALSRRGVRITVVTTPRNVAGMRPYITHDRIHIAMIEFPGGSNTIENMSQTRSKDDVIALMRSTKLLREPFMAAMRAMEDPPHCVISDSFLGWTNAVCRELGIRRIVFNGMGVFAMAVKKVLSVDRAHVGSDAGEKVIVRLRTRPSFDITVGDLPSSLRMSDEVSEFFLEADRSDSGSWGVIANSFAELEKSYVASLEDLYGKGTKVFCVGPLFMHGESGLRPSGEWADWLDRKGKERERSVIYVCFGSQANLADDRLDELALGLELSGEVYLWVVRSKTWTGPQSPVSNGLVVREWVDQKWVLGHVAVGGFLSHCGWNSALEGVGNGVPVLTWPIEAEQYLNAKYLVEGLRVGLGLRGGGASEICGGVSELMSGARSGQARKKAAEYGKMAERAVRAGGSSCNNLDDFVRLLQ